MQQITITIPQEKSITYPIIIGECVLEKISSYIDFSNYTKIIIITDKHIPETIIEKVKQGAGNTTSVIAIEGNDSHKTIEQVQIIWQELSHAGCDRKSLVVIVGGGTLSDMAGFAASTYMRGIDFITIPTTLLAQVDASVGGKTGINFLHIKNLIGTFHQPKAVFIDVDTLASLPKREFISGFAEIIKHGIIADKTYFEKVTAKKPEDYTTEELTDIISGSCEIKAAIVQNDETEQDKRKLLNVGHTIGHAIEAISLETNKPLLHGEAISIGMVAEAKIAEEIGLLSHGESTEIKQSLIHTGLPVIIQNMEVNEIIGRMKKDKKNIGGNINFTLIKTLGEALCDQQVEEKVIKDILTLSSRT